MISYAPSVCRPGALAEFARELVRKIGPAAAIAYCRNNHWDGIIARIADAPDPASADSAIRHIADR